MAHKPRSWHLAFVLVPLIVGCVPEARLPQNSTADSSPTRLVRRVSFSALEVDSQATCRTLALATMRLPLVQDVVRIIEVSPAVLHGPWEPETLLPLTAATIRPTVKAEQWDGQTYEVEVEVPMSPPRIVDALRRLGEDPDTIDGLQEQFRRTQALVEDIMGLRDRLQVTAEPPAHLRLVRTYLAHLQTLEGLHWLHDGIVELHGGDAKSAIIRFSASLELLSDDAEAYHQRAMAYRLLEQFETALEDASRAIALKPDRARYAHHRGLIHARLGAYPQALADLNRALDLQADRALTYVQRGMVRVAMGKLQEAAADLTRALDLNPQLGRAYYNRGTVYSKLGDYDQALADFSRTLELDPRDAAAYNNRGVIYSLLDDHEQAVQDFTHAIALRPRDAKAYFNRARSLLRLGQYRQAIRDFSTAVELDPQLTEMYAQRAMAYEALGEIQPAVEDYRRALDANPDQPAVYYHLARLYHRLGQNADAVRHLRAALERKHRQLISDLQRQLKTAGFDPGPVDGMLGPRTRAAIRNFQKSRGLPASGDLDDATLQAFLEASGAASP